MKEPNTPEQTALRAELLKEYGRCVLNQACCLAKVANGVMALGSRKLSDAERAECFAHLTVHICELVSSLVPTADEALRITQCARRVDEAVDLWISDEIEKEEGLPPMPKMSYDPKR